MQASLEEELARNEAAEHDFVKRNIQVHIHHASRFTLIKYQSQLAADGSAGVLAMTEAEKQRLHELLDANDTADDDITDAARELVMPRD